MGFVGRKPTNAPLTSDDIPNGIIGAEDLAAGLSKITFDTTPKTTGFTAVANTGYFCNTTSAGFTVTLPATPSAGDQVQLVDYAGTFDTNALVINPNGEDIEGSASNFQLTGEREGVILTYIDSTQGWIATSGINEGTDALEPESYSIDFLVIAGGGGGGSLGGGGGAGGYRASTQTVNIGTAITVTVGDGGGGSTTQSGSTSLGTSGNNSSISGSGLTTITSAGGGGGGSYDIGSGLSGGSGGGAGSQNGVGGSGNTPSTAPSQGNNGGGQSASEPAYGAGGGGGANAVGDNGTSSKGGDGGAGTASSISGSSVTRAGGGGGSAYAGSSGGTGGTGGGGDGGGGTVGTAGVVNTGGGGGGGGIDGIFYNGASGGKGVVILSMPLAKFSSTVTGSPTESDDGTTKVLVFNGSGSYTT
jgi:hypothetical protein